jgi:hypothetical protein
MYLFLAKGALVRHFGIPLCSIDTGYLFAIHNSFKTTIYSLEGAQVGPERGIFVSPWIYVHSAYEKL